MSWVVIERQPGGMISVQASTRQPHPTNPFCPLFLQCTQHQANRPPGLTCPQHDKSTKSTMSTFSTWFIFEPFRELWALLMLGSAFKFVLNCECSRLFSSTADSCYWCSICVWHSPLQLHCGTMHRTMLYAAWPVAVCTMLRGPLHLHVIGFDQIRRGPQAGQAPAKWPQLCCLCTDL